jgi:hypothetical protein
MRSPRTSTSPGNRPAPLPSKISALVKSVAIHPELQYPARLHAGTVRFDAFLKAFGGPGVAILHGLHRLDHFLILGKAQFGQRAQRLHLFGRGSEVPGLCPEVMHVGLINRRCCMADPEPASDLPCRRFDHVDSRYLQGGSDEGAIIFPIVGRTGRQAHRLGEGGRERTAGE